MITVSSALGANAVLHRLDGTILLRSVRQADLGGLYLVVVIDDQRVQFRSVACTDLGLQLFEETAF